MANRKTKQRAVLTIGHSTRPIEEFTSLLKENDVTLLADVRTVPRSRHNPQFNKDELPASLDKEGIGYVHLTGLGGLRHSRKDSVNTGWRNASFRGYADYMQTPEFAEAVDGLIELAATQQVAIMCAEAVPWRCHRSMIGDALLARGIEVLDIMGPNSVKQHEMTKFAEVSGTAITYPPEKG